MEMMVKNIDFNNVEKNELMKKPAINLDTSISVIVIKRKMFHKTF